MRLGIAVRLFGIVLLIAFLGLQGAALKTRAFDGETNHYTVVLNSGVDASLIASRHSGDGVHVEHVNSGDVNGYSATMPSDRAASLLHDSNVAYVEYDTKVKVRHGWVETMKLTIDDLLPHI